MGLLLVEESTFVAGRQGRDSLLSRVSDALLAFVSRLCSVVDLEIARVCIMVVRCNWKDGLLVDGGYGPTSIA